MAMLPWIDEDEKSGISIARASSDDHSHTYSVTDGEGSRIRAPGVVARLMGLDSMPSSVSSKPHSTSINDSQVLRANFGGNRKCRSSNAILKDGAYSRKTLVSRQERMLNSPIERSQVEALPPRLAKPTSHELISPVRTPGLISAKATKDELQSSSSSSSPLKVSDSRKITANSKKTSKPSESSGSSAQSVAFKSSRSQYLGGCQNALENSKSLPGIKETTQAGAKDKGKSVSLAIQAKLNVRRREGSSANTKNKLIVEENDEHHINRTLKFRSIHQTSNQNKGGGDSFNAPQQTIQKYMASERKLAPKPSVSDQRDRKLHSKDAYPGQDKVVNDLPGNSKVCYKIRKGSKTAGTGKDRFILNNKNTGKKKLLEQGSYSKIRDSVDNMPVDKPKKHIQHNVAIRNHLRQPDDNTSNAADVVSFTFTSPLIKPVHGSHSNNHEEEKIVEKRAYIYPFSEAASGSECKNLSSRKLNTIKGDHLGFLLELKLRELASETQSTCCKSTEGHGTAASLPDSRDSASTFDESFVQSIEDELSSSNPNCSVASSQVPCVRHKLQEVNRIDCCCSTADPREPGHQDQSPLSILENSFSNESCCYSESFENADGSRTDSSYSSILDEDIVEMDCIDKTLSAECEMELSDLASSNKQILDLGLVSEIGISDRAETVWGGLEYVKEILTISEFIFDDLILYFMDQSDEIFDPLLFEKLEENQSLTACEVEERHRRMRRKIIFDSANECLETKYSHYFRAGFRMWSKGVVLAAKDLSHELHDEISGWNSIEDLMVDELVAKDMSTYLGRWIDFEIEAFQAGVEIQRWLLDTLVDEVVADFQISDPQDI
ncbi:unnamed protein product [Musa acuminata subsp. malaccensis]|uniref:(wild Malaysian banana) hypothetical protein n=1 Tax=Musa acuminata subsp. malaccensis TaxID=214687 RepID=A0A804LB93_MUSAM|nr:PREDICTED: uncharacterized protein LOC103972401 isoform X1 [Musa acuminata subsp. malaccensis]XP_018675846.1 PREDICTED: uncharacterized protein LOC103972401 isoform X1 [Musa acuminata subsp. malaccensis]CAG1865483.1 unnamed protein product [Musa acuminata subsp. malaccensis]